MLYVNDIHSGLNKTALRKIAAPHSLNALQEAIAEARLHGMHISVAGGRHAMGGQQFGEHTLLIDTQFLNKTLDFNKETGIIEVEAGIQWPEVLEELERLQPNASTPWGVLQTQTGASRLSIGGALSANIHGRGLTLKPIIQDVESFVLVTAEGKSVQCSREKNSELFRLAIGGYGLLGIIYSVRLRLAPRRKLERVVEVTEVHGIIERFNERIRDGYLYGDFQLNVDETAKDFLTTGIFACYRPVDMATPLLEGHRELAEEDWMNLLYLAHADRAEGFKRYAEFYLSTNGQIYWSDSHQLGVYLDGYHTELDKRLGTPHPGSEVITELYVPRERLVNFLHEIREDLREQNTIVIYGTVRLIEQDSESVLAWAKESYACIILNLCTRHTPKDIEQAANTFRHLIDAAAARGGSYYLTYHRFARPDQIKQCYPRFTEFLKAKRAYDPQELFQSNWYRQVRNMNDER